MKLVVAITVLDALAALGVGALLAFGEQPDGGIVTMALVATVSFLIGLDLIALKRWPEARP